ncbi:Histone-lysine N-methyltransferase MLL3, partial [Stegodyphus mimosarum]
MACHESGDLSQLLLCTSCANYYHGNCMDPPIMPSPDVRAGWQCLDCKVCQNCRQPGDNSKMMVCNTCDKGYHTFCVKPAIASVPKSGWKCSACRMCGDCGARTPGNGPSSRWHMNYSVCDSCYQQRNKGIACPLCGKAYRQFSQRKTMKHCSVCQKYIHEECDRRTGLDTMNYVCPVCAASEVRNLDCSFEVNNLKDICHSSSRDSFLTGNEESLSSADSDCFFDAVSNKISGRRTSASELRRKKPSKSKFKSYSIPGMLGPVSISPKEYKMDDDDPTEDNKMILASATDEFVLCQDLCLMCGSFGKGEEGKLLSCAQCGQCYHIYCANIKVTTVVLKKGWRCLDCTVCEECGQPHDEGRLLLCDECDLSFHTYCLDPPLEEVPTGNWKCKWCVMCIKCGSKSAGINCVWQENYTLCGPCASYVVCCLCQQEYEENELIIQCQRCERWLHGMCDQIDTEDQAEKCADYGYTCPHCRPSDELPPHLL